VSILLIVQLVNHDYFTSLNKILNFVEKYTFSIHSYLVVSILCDVADPRKRLITALLDNFKITHLNATDCEVRYLELQLDWYFLVVISSVVLNWREPKLSAHEELFAARELLNDPNHAAFIWNIFDCAHIGFENRWIDINWNRNYDFNIVCYGFLFELGSRFDHKFYFRLSTIFNSGFYPYQRLYMGVNSIWHQIKLAIWWYESN